MKKVLTTILFCASIYFYAQTGTVSGKINDDHQISLPGAKLTLSPGNHYTISDAEGNFVFLDLPEGSYDLAVDYIG